MDFLDFIPPQNVPNSDAQVLGIFETVNDGLNILGSL